LENDYFIEQAYSETKFSWKKFIQSFLPPIIFAFVILIMIWVFDYFNPVGENILLNYINTFFLNNWFTFIFFILIFSVWDYLFKIFYKSKLRYIAPIVSSLGAIFAIWIIALIFKGLSLLLEIENPFYLFFTFLYDLFYSQTILLFCLILLIYYSKFFLNDYKH